MKPTKMRNQMIYQATYKTKSKQLASALSKDLHKKYGKRSVRVVVGDSIKILRGEFKGVDGKISQVSTQKNSVAIEGIKKEKTKGEKFDVYIHTSNLMVTSLNSEDKWRIAKLEGKDPRKQPKVPRAKTGGGADSVKEADTTTTTTTVTPKEETAVTEKTKDKVDTQETKPVKETGGNIETKSVKEPGGNIEAPKPVKEPPTKETKGAKEPKKAEDEN